MKKILYPGSFDPLTNGHLDLIIRAAKLFDEVVVLVAENVNKQPFIPYDKRVLLIKQALTELKLQNVKVMTSNDLTVNVCHKENINYLLRGLRNGDELDSEATLNYFNQLIDNSIETIFLLSSDQYRFVSSSKIRELFHYKIVPHKLLPKCVAKYLADSLD